MTSRIDYNNPDRTGAFCGPYHYELLSDDGRVEALKAAIGVLVPGRRVLESGTGSGILATMAARAGAAHVYATEIDPVMADVAERNFVASGIQDRVTLLRMDTRAVQLEDLGGAPVDVAIAENLSTWQVTEPQVAVLNHLNGVVQPHSRPVWVPNLIENFVELASSRFVFEGTVSFRSHYFQFTGIPQPTSLSPPVLGHQLDCGAIHTLDGSARVVCEAFRPGVVNSLRLTSRVTLAPGVVFDGSDSLLPPVIVPLHDDLEVGSAVRVAVEVAFRRGSEWSDFECAASLL